MHIKIFSYQLLFWRPLNTIKDNPFNRFSVIKSFPALIVLRYFQYNKSSFVIFFKLLRRRNIACYSTCLCWWSKYKFSFALFGLCVYCCFCISTKFILTTFLGGSFIALNKTAQHNVTLVLSCSSLVNHWTSFW